MEKKSKLCVSEMAVPIDDFDGNEYIFFPACVYDGNRFPSLSKSYPPMFSREEAGVDLPVTITDVPRLNEDGSGAIEVTTGDVSVPCMGMFSRERKQGMLIFTVQEVDGANLGLSYSDGVFRITTPSNRKRLYCAIGVMIDNPGYCPDPERGTAEIPYKVIRFACEDMVAFYAKFFENRKVMGLDATRPEGISEAEQWALQREKFNAECYGEPWGYNLLNTRGLYPLAWVNNSIGYPFMKLGDQTDWERGLKTLRYPYRFQAASGFLPSRLDREGTVGGDAHGAPGTEHWHMVRRSGEMLYSTCKHFDLFRERGVAIPDDLIRGAKALADGFVTLWKRYGQLGQIIDYVTGEILVGGSTAGAIVAGGLAKASLFFDDPDYLQVAEAIGEQLYTRDALAGYTVGGPGEVLQCPDSESAFLLLESLVALYEVTGEAMWCHRAEHVARLCSSWVVSYNFRFPQGSEFARLDIKTVGTLFANIQNKHSAPGVCVLSGDSLYKLYRFTGNADYLELLLDIKQAIPQCMSTEERPIYAYALTEQERDDRGVPYTAARQEPGRICERVNMSDWESPIRVGAIWGGIHNWPEVSNLLTLADLPQSLLTEAL